MLQLQAVRCFAEDIVRQLKYMIDAFDRWAQEESVTDDNGISLTHSAAVVELGAGKWVLQGKGDGGDGEEQKDAKGSLEIKT